MRVSKNTLHASIKEEEFEDLENIEDKLASLFGYRFVSKLDAWL